MCTPSHHAMMSPKSESERRHVILYSAANHPCRHASCNWYFMFILSNGIGPAKEEFVLDSFTSVRGKGYNLSWFCKRAHLGKYPVLFYITRAPFMLVGRPMTPRSSPKSAKSSTFISSSIISRIIYFAYRCLASTNVSPRSDNPLRLRSWRLHSTSIIKAIIYDLFHYARYDSFVDAFSALR